MLKCVGLLIWWKDDLVKKKLKQALGSWESPATFVEMLRRSAKGAQLQGDPHLAGTLGQAANIIDAYNDIIDEDLT
jgi:sRNA-binding protein